MTKKEALKISLIIEDIIRTTAWWDTCTAKEAVGSLMDLSPKIAEWLRYGNDDQVKEWIRHCFGDDALPEHATAREDSDA